MKLAVAFSGVLLAMAVAGPVALNPGAPIHRDQLAAISVPQWLNLPSTPFISSIEYSGEIGVEAAFGAIAYSLPSDGSSELNWLKAHLEADGFQIDDRTSTIDNFAGADTVISAENAATGRRVILVRVQTIEGANLRVSFEDPLAGLQISGI